MNRYAYLASSAFLALIVSAYCFSDPQPRADFVYVNPSGIHTLDPARMSWSQDFRVALNLWEGLTTSDPVTTEPVRGAAVFPPTISDDGLTYTFSIRPDARWSNGDPVSADDFIRGWRRSMEPGTGTDYTYLFANNIAGADAYIRWRRRGAAVLTALDRLRRGWGIDERQSQSLVSSPVFQHFHPSFRHPQTPGRADEESESLTDRLANLSTDWNRLYDEAFHQHTKELDRRFEAVALRALDDRTLEVGLIRPCPYFLDLTAFPTFLPCHVSIERLRERYRNEPITAEGLVVYDPQWTKPNYHKNDYPGLVTNGAYRLREWRFKRRARWEVNPFFRDASTVRCRTVDMVVFSNISASIMAYEAGDVDFLPSLDVPYDHEIARLSRTGERPDFIQCAAFATYFLSFNCASDSVLGRPNPFVDARVRKAFALAIDKTAIVESVLRRGDRIAGAFVPPGSIDGYSSPRGLAHDSTEAKRLLAEAGYPLGHRLPVVDILYVPSDERVVQAIGRMWEQTLGAVVELRCKETKTFADDKANKRFMVARGNWYGDYYDPTTFLDCLSTDNGNNDSGYSSPRYDDLMQRATQQRNPARRLSLLSQAETWAIEQDVPITPILHYAVPIAIKPNVTGLYPNSRMRFLFRYVSVDR